MKPYFFLLAVLYLARLARNLQVVTATSSAVLVFLALAEVVLFGLCLRGVHAFAWKKAWWDRPKLRMLYQATLTLGALSVIFLGFGDRLGLAVPGTFTILDLAFMFLRCGLFAAPIIAMEHDLRARG